MAKGKSPKRKMRMKKRGRSRAVTIDDTQRVMTLVSPNDASSGTLTIHVPDMLMRANRRQYTQCRAYDCRVKLSTNNTADEKMFNVYTLSNAWWVKKSIEMAKGVWLENTKKERALLGDNKAKYNDFIISCITGAAGNFANLFQYAPASSGDDMTATEVAFDESLYETFGNSSTVKNDSAAAIGFTVTGALSSPNTYNIFDQYLLSRSVTADADARSGPYQDLFQLDEDALTSLQTKGDLPAWDADAFPSPFVLQDTISLDQGTQTPPGTWSRMFTAPLGIVIVKKFTSAGAEENYSGNESILLEARKGTYKGVHAPAYRALKGLHTGLA